MKFNNLKLYRCFAMDTSVEMADGRFIIAKDIEVGHILFCYEEKIFDKIEFIRQICNYNRAVSHVWSR
ncbi:MAG: hypothetical protein LBD23_19375 [Oscillospiraceae bacterium]|jgi:hypothetical protein|nr:hypothetical protein [Oscillospiraceae bacterium]